MLRIDINLVFTIINLLLLFVAMRIFFFKPIKKILDERQKEADRQFAEAKEKQEEAERLKAQYESSLAQTQEERKKIIAQARKDADEEYVKIVKQAESEAEEVRTSAQTEAENQKARMMKKAETEITDMAVKAAAKVVGQQSGAKADSALYDLFLNKAGDAE